MRVAIFLLSISLAAAQDDKCTIAGTVLNAKTNQPIKKVGVLLRPEYSSGGMTAGVLTLAAGQTLKDLAYRLWPTAVIAGRVVDEDGNPMDRSRWRNWPRAYTA
jgi:hypothetical protein